MLKHYDRLTVQKWARRERAGTRLKTSIYNLIGSETRFQGKLQKYRATADAITEVLGP